MRKIVIVGAGTASDVVFDILKDKMDIDVVGVIGEEKTGSHFTKKILAETDEQYFEEVIALEEFYYIIAVGNPTLSEKLYNKYKKKGLSFINAIHKTVNIDGGVKIGENNIIGAFSQIGTMTKIGNNNWIASHVNIDHHNTIGNNNLFGPGCALAGSVTIGNNSILGINVSINKNIKIGDNVTIVSGESVFKNIQDNEIIKRKK